MLVHGLVLHQARTEISSVLEKKHAFLCSVAEYGRLPSLLWVTIDPRKTRSDSNLYL